MDILYFIRSIIFLVGGLVTIIFRKELNNFKNRLFRDSFTNTNSNKLKNGAFFVIYLDKEVPKFIPKNVILLFDLILIITCIMGVHQSLIDKWLTR